ncbi:MAG TPA: cytochrome c [Clostridia bacterium]|nr:cytochrome c [Clostridia bacterium]
MKKTIIATAILAMALPAFAADGAALYKAKCQMCHAPDGSKAAPNLATLTVEQTIEITAKGKAPKMPAYESKLSAEEIKAVSEFMKSLKK